MPVLILTLDDDVQVIELPDGQPVYVGRSADCDICITSPLVSRRHAVFIYQNGICGVKDLQSFNGTFLNGAAVTQPTVLSDGDTIKVTKYPITFKHTRNPAAKTAVIGSSDTGYRLPRSMVTPETLNYMMEGIQPPPSSPYPQIGDDTRIFTRDRKTELRRGGTSRLAPTTLVPGESNRLGPRVSRGTAIIVKRDLKDNIGDDYIAQSLGLGEEPPPAPQPPSGPGMFNLRTTEPVADVPAQDDASASRPAGKADKDGTDVVMTQLKGMEVGQRQPASRMSGRRTSVSRRRRSNSIIRRVKPDMGTKETDRIEKPDASSRAPEEIVGSPHVAEMVSEPERQEPGPAVSNPKRQLSGAQALQISSELREAIEARLAMYDELHRLSRRRRIMRTKGPSLPPEVLAELDRQDQEFKNIPLPREIGKAGTDAVDAESVAPELRLAQEMAMVQWQAMEKSAREDLPEVFAQAYKAAATETFPLELAKAGVEHRDLIGGSVYYLALEILQGEVQRETEWLAARKKDAEEESRRGNTVIRKLYDLIVSNPQDDEEDGDAKMKAEEQEFRRRNVWLRRELAFMEKLLAREFRRVYIEVAACFSANPAEMPIPVRAFLRFGAISFKPWWMADEVHRYIVLECAGKVRECLDDIAGKPEVNVLYADEYLSFVMGGECSPMPVEWSAEDRDAEETDRYYRRVIDGDVRLRMLGDLSEEMRKRVELEEENAERISREIADAEREGGRSQGEMLRLRRELQVCRQGLEALRANCERLESGVIPAVGEMVNDAEDVFSSGERIIPDPDEIVRGECGVLGSVGEGLRDVEMGWGFMPLVIRDRFVVSADVIVNRGEVRQVLEEAEGGEPAIFIDDVFGDGGGGGLRIPPMVVIIPAFGSKTRVCCGRSGMERGRLAVPVCFTRSKVRRHQLHKMVAAYRKASLTGEQ